MDGLILAAGSGSRLGSSTPKCLTRIGGRSLLDIQIAALRRVGVHRIHVAVGYREAEIRAAVTGVRFIHNRRYAETNSLYTFHLARRLPHTDLCVLNGDVLFPDDLLDRVLDQGASAVAFDSSSGGDPEHMKVNLCSGRLVEMRKDLPPSATSGENVGLLYLSAAAARASFHAAADLVAEGREHEWVGTAISAVARHHHIAGVDIRGLPWVEIDFPADLAAARTTVWPAIAERHALAAAQRILHRPRTAVTSAPHREAMG